MKYPRLRQFVLGISAGLTAQALMALWHWLRAPAARPATAAPTERR